MKDMAWIFRTPRPAAKVRLFCFPFAGGSAGVYRIWGEQLPAHIEVCPYELPGRGPRLDDPKCDTVEALARDVLSRIEPLLDKPFAFYGHSLGGRVLCEVTLALAQKGKTPVHLFASACQAPDSPSPWRILHMNDREYVAELRRMGTVPREVLDDPDMLEVFLPVLRADFACVERYNRAPVKLDAPMTVLIAKNDAIVPRDRALAWENYAGKSIRFVDIDGDHFFLNAQRARVLEEIQRDLVRFA